MSRGRRTLTHSALPPFPIREVIGCRDPERLRQMLAGGHPEVVVHVAGNRATPPDLLDQLADPAASERLVRTLLHNPLLPPGALTRFASAPENEWRALVGRHHSTPPATLARLADDPCEAVRWSVTGNPAAPSHALEALEASAPPIVWWQERIAGNPAMGLPALRRLAVNRSPIVRATLAANPSAALDPECVAGLLEVEASRLHLARARGTKRVTLAPALKAMIHELDDMARWDPVAPRLSADARALLSARWRGESKLAAERRRLMASC